MRDSESTHAQVPVRFRAPYRQKIEERLNREAESLLEDEAFLEAGSPGARQKVAFFKVDRAGIDRNYHYRGPKLAGSLYQRDIQPKVDAGTVGKIKYLLRKDTKLPKRVSERCCS